MGYGQVTQLTNTDKVLSRCKALYVVGKPQGRYSYGSHITDGKTEAQGGLMVKRSYKTWGLEHSRASVRTGFHPY